MVQRGRVKESKRAESARSGRAPYGSDGGLRRVPLEPLFREIERIVTAGGLELVDVEFKRERGARVLRVFIDKRGGVSVDDCARISNEIGMMLDVENAIPQSYTLEVSSPGLDRPLRKAEDFERFAGRNVRIKLNAERAGRKKFRGRLEGLDGDEVVIFDEAEARIHTFPLDDIAYARLEIEL